MKVKDLNFVNGEASLLGFVNGNSNIKKSFKLRYFLIDKVSSRSYYVYAKQYGHDFPTCGYRVSANASVESVVSDVLALLS